LINTRQQPQGYAQCSCTRTQPWARALRLADSEQTRWFQSSRSTGHIDDRVGQFPKHEHGLFALAVEVFEQGQGLLVEAYTTFLIPVDNSGRKDLVARIFQSDTERLEDLNRGSLTGSVSAGSTGRQLRRHRGRLFSRSFAEADLAEVGGSRSVIVWLFRDISSAPSYLEMPLAKVRSAKEHQERDEVTCHLTLTRLVSSKPG
ncbi:hypothetical protein KCU88_g49, partial [Aureobasidium melanogenum]